MTDRDLSPDCTAEVPQEWQDIGFSGFFTRESTLVGWDDETLATFLARLPQFVPRSNSVMVLREVPDQPEPTVILVFKDAAAMMATFTSKRAN